MSFSFWQEGTDDGTAVMIVGNKTDLIEEDSERPVKSQDGKKLAEVSRIVICKCLVKITGYFRLQTSFKPLYVR